PWSDASGSTGSRPDEPACGRGNTRATITFAVVAVVIPLGKPAGYENPDGSKKLFVWSIPSSTTAIFSTVPCAPVVCCSTSAPITEGARTVGSRYATLG